MKKYYDQITGLRGIFCVAIVVYHLFFRYRGLEAFGLIPNIAIVWGGFFVISGFFLHYENVKQYWVGKITNIIIPFWLAVTIIYIIRIIFEKGYSSNIVTLFLNYLVFPNFVGVELVDGAHWFVEKLIYFYIIFWFINICGGKKWRMLLNAYAIGCCISIFLISNNTNVVKLIKVIFDSRFLFLIFGINLSRYKKEVKNDNMIVLIINLLMICYWFIVYTHWSNCIYFILILAIIILSLQGKLRFLTNRILLLLGTSSYFIYLLHQRIGYIIIESFDEYYFGFAIAMITVLIIPTILCKSYKKMLKTINGGRDN